MIAPALPDDPVLPDHERIRREEWSAVPEHMKQEIQRLHTNLGHPSTPGMLRLLRRAGAKPDAIAAARVYSCPICANRNTGRHPRPARVSENYSFNQLVLLDTLYVHDSRGNLCSLLNIVCDGTTFQ